MRDYNRNEDFHNRWESRMERRSGSGHVWTGLFIILIGIAALIRISNPDLPHWLFGWQMFLIALGLFWGLKDGFDGGWFILVLIGSLFLVRDIYPHISIGRYIWPIVLIIIGSYIVLKPRNRKKTHFHFGQRSRPDGSVYEEVRIVDEANDTKEDYADATSVFGGVKKNIISKNFKGGDLVNIFGGTELDLTRADFNGVATIEVTNIFGGCKLLVPSNWLVKQEANSIFGGLEDKRNMQTLSDTSNKTLIIKGTIIFGGVEIKSF